VKGDIKIKAKILTFLLAFCILITNTSCKSENIAINQVKKVPIINLPKGASMSFIVMADCRGSDNGINFKTVTQTLKVIKKIQPQPLFAVMPGDLVGGSWSYSGIKNQLLYFKQTVTKYYPLSFFYPGFGNHEASAGTKGEQAFEEVFSDIKANFLKGYHKTVYFFDKNNIRFYMLNSNHPGNDHIISNTQLNWIKANQDAKKKYNLYFFHEPAYPTGAHVGSSLDVNSLQRDKLWEIIDRSNNPMVFCGHEHNYTRRHINSSFNEIVNKRSFKFNKRVYQVTTGTFGAPLYTGFTSKKNVDVPPIPQYHFAVVNVYKSKLGVTVYNLDGKVIDHFEQ
jgi:hypothetical protein